MATNLPAPPNASISPAALPLSPRELLVAKLFADDHPANDIGLALGLTLETVRSYLSRVRLKYAEVNRPASNRVQLRLRLVEDGFMRE